MHHPAIIIVMGVSGCGKSTMGKNLADELHVPYIDADDLHPKANVDKMASGEPLNDQDRFPWLNIVRTAAVKTCRVEGSAGHETGVVIGCSALKRIYRDLLRGISDEEVETLPSHVHGDKLPTYFCFINGPKEVLFERMTARKNHFMKAKMLESQIATLEDPIGEDKVIPINLEDSMDDQVKSALHALAQYGIHPAEPAAVPSPPPAREDIVEGVLIECAA